MARYLDLTGLSYYSSKLKKDLSKGSSYIFVGGNGTPQENALELQAAYNEAKTMSPSSGNIITVVVSPGTYTFGETAFIVDTPYINIVSLTGNPDVLLDEVNVTANNIYLKGIDVGNKQFLIASNLDELVCENCTGGNGSFGGDGGTASGTFTDCTGGYNSFGGSGTASGTFTNCTGVGDSFGGNSGTASGTFNHCTAGNASFGCSGIASGIFTNCTGEFGSFGGSGTVSGTFNNCTGKDGSFGGGGGGAISSTARLYYCRLTSGTFETPASGGKIVACIDGNDDFIMIS